MTFAAVLALVSLGSAGASPCPYPADATYLQKLSVLHDPASADAIKDFLNDLSVSLADRLEVHWMSRHAGLPAEVAALPELSDRVGVEELFQSQGGSRTATIRDDFRGDTYSKAYLGSIQILWRSATTELEVEGPAFREKQRQIHATGFVTRMNLLGLLRAQKKLSRDQGLVRLGLSNLKSFLKQAEGATAILKSQRLDILTAVETDKTAEQARLRLVKNAYFLAEISHDTLASLLQLADAKDASVFAVSAVATEGQGYRLEGSPVTGALWAVAAEAIPTRELAARVAQDLYGKKSTVSEETLVVMEALAGVALPAGGRLLVSPLLPEFALSNLNRPLLKSDFDPNFTAGDGYCGNCYSTARKFAFGAEFPHEAIEPAEFRHLLEERFERVDVQSDADLRPGDVLTYWGFQLVPVQGETNPDGNAGPSKGKSLTGGQYVNEILHAATYLGSGLTFSKASSLYSSDHRVKCLAEETLNSSIKSRQVWRRKALQ